MSETRHFRSRDLRKGRRSLAGHAYVITTVCACREPVFREFEIACAASRSIASREAWHDAALLAWVLMPDHLHALVQLGSSASLSQVVGRVKWQSARTVNLARCRGDVVWQDGFHDRALRRDEGLQGAARYLLANPLRAGLAASPADYSFWGSIWPGIEADPG